MDGKPLHFGFRVIDNGDMVFRALFSPVAVRFSAAAIGVSPGPVTGASILLTGYLLQVSSIMFARWRANQRFREGYRMRLLLVFCAFAAVMLAPIANAGMHLTLVMVPPQQLAHLSTHQAELNRLLTQGGPDIRLDGDKEWHGIHYLLTGDPWSTEGPYGQVILGGEPIGPDLGYGPPRALNAEKVREIAARLQALPIDELKKRYSPSEMMRVGIYPNVWEIDGPDGLTWLLEGYHRVVEFYVKAASQGKGMVLALL
jgi:hypothetical protein